MEKMEKIYILETNEVIKDYSFVENIKEMLKADFVYFTYTKGDVVLREATEVEKKLINSLVGVCNETGYSAGGLE